MLMLPFDLSWPWSLQHADQIPAAKLCCEVDDEDCFTYCYGEAPHIAAALQPRPFRSCVCSGSS